MSRSSPLVAFVVGLTCFAACRPVPVTSPSIPAAVPPESVADDPAPTPTPSPRPTAAPRRAPAPTPLHARIDARIAELQPQIVAWRRDLHAHPELGNRETRTAGVVAAHLRALGLSVRTEVAHTGVVGVLNGGRDGPVVALRADMDALPVREEVDVPFTSQVTTTYRGQTTHVMHACGHDLHTSILMGVADALASVRDELPGTVVFVFQPAEEGAPEGERGGAELMIEQGALADPRPEAIFGLHVIPRRVGEIFYRAGGTMAASDELRIVVRGTQTHGAYPWRGVDPITVAAQILLALQTIPSRQLDATIAPTVVSIGSIHGGIRSNIIPDEVELVGTTRTFDPQMRERLHARIEATAGKIAESAGATAEVTFDGGYPVTFNDPELTAWLLPTLQRVAGADHVHERSRTMGAEDFSFYQQQIPGVYFFLGIVPADQDPATAASNHSPRFFADEAALTLGARALAHAALDYLHSGPAAAP